MSNKHYIVYDTSKNMNVDINPAFIQGLQTIYARYITQFYEDASQFGQLIKDFNELITDPEAAKEKNREFTPIESELYTLYSIINLLKSFAKEQGLEKYEELKVTEEDFKAMVTDINKDTNNPTEMLQKLADKLSAAQQS